MFVSPLAERSQSSPFRFPPPLLSVIACHPHQTSTAMHTRHYQRRLIPHRLQQNKKPSLSNSTALTPLLPQPHFRTTPSALSEASHVRRGRRPTVPPLAHLSRFCRRSPTPLSAAPQLLRTLPPTPSSLRCSGNEFAGEEVMQLFEKDRQMHGDFVSRIYDNLWRKASARFSEDINVGEEKSRQVDTLEMEDDNMERNDGFLKLSKTIVRASSENVASINNKLVKKKWKDDGEKRKKVNILKYEALKGELLLLTIGIGAACGVYCLVILSTEVAISYSVGVLLSCLYLQLLSTYTDNLSKKSIPRIFIQEKVKKIGIRSEDLKNSLEKILNGTSIALSTPRLVLPSALYGLWALSRQFCDIFDFQLVPAMLGFFAYKAAALVQVYRDNEDLSIIFPENEDNS